MRNFYIVNASPLLTFAEVETKIAPLQLQYDRDFEPAWRGRVEPGIRYVPLDRGNIQTLTRADYAIFCNKHSTEAGDLGWHDDEDGWQYSRVFIGDCMRSGLDWGVTVSHEALELLADPDIKRVWKMPNGRLASLEVSDPVEADEQAIDYLGHKMSNFVFPPYFSTTPGVPYDFLGRLQAPCPELTDGGYLPVTDGRGEWTQVQQDHQDGLAGRRALAAGHRRSRRSRWLPGELEFV